MKMAANETSTSPLEALDDPDKDEYFYSIKKRIYQSAKEGFSLNLQVLISRVDTMEIRNVLVNQASALNNSWSFEHVRMENFPNHLRLAAKRAIFFLLFREWSWKKLNRRDSRLTSGYLSLMLPSSV